jgi:hypothetical protein
MLLLIATTITWETMTVEIQVRLKLGKENNLVLLSHPKVTLSSRPVNAGQFKNQTPYVKIRNAGRLK